MLAASLTQCQRDIADRHVRPDDLTAFVQSCTTLLPIAALWWATPVAEDASPWLTLGLMALMTLFLLRVFVMMHECGHGSLFRTQELNRVFGFVFGVIAGMPQYVWSQHHQYHHSTNGNWSKYRGPMNIIPVQEYAGMTAGQQRRYRVVRSVWIAPLAGLLYLIVIPRVTWIRGGLALTRDVIAGKLSEPQVPIAVLARRFSRPYCASLREYQHMFWNNVALMVLWCLMAWAIGPLLFFSCYLLTLSLAGGVAIILFTVQHNFEHSYASEDQGWDRNTAAIHGTSFLILPPVLNWFTANIAYHHVHHLCARIPNYCLVQCHKEQSAMFADVTRITLLQIPGALKYILWDQAGRRLISVAEHLSRATA